MTSIKKSMIIDFCYYEICFHNIDNFLYLKQYSFMNFFFVKLTHGDHAGVSVNYIYDLRKHL